MEAAVIEQKPTIERPQPRRFELPDLDRHGGWLVERLARAYFKRTENDLPAPVTNSGLIGAFLKGCLYSNEFMFLYHDHAVGLAQLDPGGSLSALPFVRERFVFVQDAENEEHVAEGADFYDRFLKWGRHQGVQAMMVGEMTDIPLEIIRSKLGRLFTKQQMFARVL